MVQLGKLPGILKMPSMDRSGTRWPNGKRLLVAAIAMALSALPASGNGLGESRSYQFRTDSQRQVFLTIERARLELQDLLGNDGAGNGFGSGTGQIGNNSYINISGDNNVVNVVQNNSGNQTQTRDCSGASFDITGGMFGC
jgi:hypothetical protein